MNRRSFLAALAGTAAGLVLPYEPRRIYSFGSAVGVVEVPRIVSITIGGREFAVNDDAEATVTMWKGPKPESVQQTIDRHRAGRFSLEEIFAARDRFAGKT